MKPEGRAEAWQRRAPSSPPLQYRAHLAVYIAAATVVFVLERLIPTPLPWVRLGLANAVTLLVLFRMGTLAALWVQLSRLLLGGLFAGTLLGPQFLLALGGGLGSWLVMAWARHAGGRWLSMLGISALGAVSHVFCQLLVVAFLFGAGDSVFTLVPLFLGIALITGTLIGVVSQVLFLRLFSHGSVAGS
jgi:heptaprenyl diphosphate synthase